MSGPSGGDHQRTFHQGGGERDERTIGLRSRPGTPPWKSVTHNLNNMMAPQTSNATNSGVCVCVCVRDLTSTRSLELNFIGGNFHTYLRKTGGYLDRSHLSRLQQFSRRSSRALCRWSISQLIWALHHVILGVTFALALAGRGIPKGGSTHWHGDPSTQDLISPARRLRLTPLGTPLPWPGGGRDQGRGPFAVPSDAFETRWDQWVSFSFFARQAEARKTLPLVLAPCIRQGPVSHAWDRRRPSNGNLTSLRKAGERFGWSKVRSNNEMRGALSTHR